MPRSLKRKESSEALAAEEGKAPPKKPKQKAQAKAKKSKAKA